MEAGKWICTQKRTNHFCPLPVRGQSRLWQPVICYKAVLRVWPGWTPGRMPRHLLSPAIFQDGKGALQLSSSSPSKPSPQRALLLLLAHLLGLVHWAALPGTNHCFGGIHPGQLPASVSRFVMVQPSCKSLGCRFACLLRFTACGSQSLPWCSCVWASVRFEPLLGLRDGFFPDFYPFLSFFPGMPLALPVRVIRPG